VWNLDFPVAPPADGSGRTYVLRIWLRPGVNFRPFGGERVAGILAPALEQWLEARLGDGIPEAPPAPSGARDLRQWLRGKEGLGLAWPTAAPPISLAVEKHPGSGGRDAHP
jgi:hypothetical protein